MNNPNLIVVFSSVFAIPPPINPATKGLIGTAIKWTIGIGIETNIIKKPTRTPLINLSSSYKFSGISNSEQIFLNHSITSGCKGIPFFLLSILTSCSGSPG